MSLYWIILNSFDTIEAAGYHADYPNCFFYLNQYNSYYNAFVKTKQQLKLLCFKRQKYKRIKIALLIVKNRSQLSIPYRTQY